MVDAGVVQKVLASLQESLEHLESKKNVDFQSFQKSKDLQAIVERRLETAIQACIDIGNHIVSQGNFGNPSDYGQIFSILMERGVLDEDLSQKLIKMVGFRNVLIHEYREILIEKVYDVLQQRLTDFYAFAKAVLNYLDKSSHHA